ncbi:MAG: hypothetical protein LBD23_17495, partial [Oscillospiraceae bacterium]|nr:hypothetical protein [Oscillospiraceae bacterium]
MNFNNLPETGVSNKLETATREHFSGISSNVNTFVERFREMPDYMLYDEEYLEEKEISKERAITLLNEI